MKTKLLTLALLATAALAGCAAPAALAPQGPSAAGSPIYEAMQDPGVGYAKRTR